jgi:ligand-binding SRPBCC domain-containing protein
MPVIEFTVPVRAPASRCFDLARSVEFHLASTGSTGETVVGGVRSGLMALGDSVTWEARHFGLRQRLTSEITAFDRPHRFRDSQIRGAFARFDHDHGFAPAPTDAGITLLSDRFDYQAPFGWLGKVAEAVFLTRYMEGFLRQRVQRLKEALESEEWRQYLPDSP